MVPDLALILAAGRGTRLRPTTDRIPKCLVQVDLRPILCRMLEDLERAGVVEVVVVVGYLGERIREEVGDSWGSMTVTYSENRDWATTNNIVSLLGAAERAKRDFFLIEGDLVWEPGASGILGMPDRAAVVPYTQGMNGTAVRISEEGTITEVIMNPVSGQIEQAFGLWKTVNAWSLSCSAFHDNLVPRMQALVRRGNHGVFYERAIAEAIADGDMNVQGVDFSKVVWVEVDDRNDLERARRLFPSEPDRSAATVHRGGKDT